MAGCATEGDGVVREEIQGKSETRTETSLAKSETSERSPTNDSPVDKREPTQDKPLAKTEGATGPDEAPDLESGRNMARSKNKKLVVVVHAPWDQQSRLLLDEGLKNAEVRKLLEDTVIVKMDFDAPETQETVRQRKIDTLPRVIFYTPDGKLYDHIKGYNDPEWLIKRLKMPPRPE
jgi:hypothetical protein